TGADSLERIGLSLVFDEAPGPARGLLTLAWEHHPTLETAYRLAWLDAGLSGPEAARPWLARARMGASPGPTPDLAAALGEGARRDAAAAIGRMSRAVATHGLDPGAHALMADLLLAAGAIDLGAVEAYATRVLAPHDATSWRRWGMVEMVQHRDLEAVQALER